MDEATRETIDQLNDKLKGIFPYRLELVNPKEIKLLDKNARYMSNEMFQNLVDNIKRDGNLSSIPLCYREEDGTLRAISGNHRVQAAVKAGLESALVMIIDGDKTKEELVAIQLSHNAISGQDDPALLKELWDEIENLDLKVYAGLDTEMVRKLESMEFAPIAEARLDFKMITFLFLPEEEERLKAVMDKLDGAFSGDTVYLASLKHYEKIFDILVKAKEGYNIMNNPTALMKIIELAEDQIGAE